MKNANEITQIHDKYLIDPYWLNKFKIKYQASKTIYDLIEANHFFNTKLWHEEDLARRLKVSDTEIANNKRCIDKYNQQRNDYIERIDTFILEKIIHLNEFKGKQNSETLGSMIDRLSILSLKIFHMALQTKRKDVEQSHLKVCSEKLKTLVKQREDLCICFDELMMDCQNGARYFKQYKQFKMYNDPNLNPEIYNEK
jgi:hypothetical protein